MSYEILAQPLAGVEAKPGSGHYAVYDHGAHVWAWQPDGSRPVLWMSEASWLEGGKPIRGGIPVCFPWFGPGRGGTMAPAHGPARLVSWRRDRVDEDADGLHVRYVLDKELLAAGDTFPYAFEATLKVDFGAEALQVALTIRNKDEQAFSYEEALHTYLSVGDVRKVTIDGLDQAPYLDKVAGAAAFDRIQDGAITFTGETDRVYVSDATVLVTDPSWDRQLVIEKAGSANTVVWNPWIAKAAAMPDFGDDEWPTMLCVEAANALDFAVTLAPGEKHTMLQRVSLG